MLLLSKLVGNTAAVAGLASALTSLVKRAVHFVKSADGLQAQAAAAEAQNHSAVAAACFPVAVHVLVGEHLKDLARSLEG
jgi:hypothetical protein